MTEKGQFPEGFLWGGATPTNARVLIILMVEVLLTLMWYPLDQTVKP